MGFKDVIYGENQRLGGNMTADEQQDLAQRGKYYILFRSIFEEIKEQLRPGETVAGYLPLTVNDNSAWGNSGGNAMNYAKSEKAKNYVEQFKDTRGNRLMIFTDQRMIFLVVMDYFEDQTYFSYEYDTIHSIYLGKKSLKYFDASLKRHRIDSYPIDFESGAHIFDEILSEADHQQLLSIKERIPAFAKIPFSKRIYRKNTFHRIVSNLQLGLNFLRLMNLFFIGLCLWWLGYFLMLVFGG